jgi:SAM-dependent methyltransferase
MQRGSGVQDVGQLYDQQIADTYDIDALGLLSGARALSIAQLERCGLAPDASILDLGVGTGESLQQLAKLCPTGRKIGIDLSARMIDIAQRKLAFEAHVDDACNAGAHVAPGSIDLAICHFLTTFVDRPRLFRAARTALRPGGVFSVVSTPDEAFGALRRHVEPIVGAAALHAANPAPKSGEALAEELEAAGFEVRSLERFRRRIVFESFEQTLTWGVKSGFFTHLIEVLDMDRLAAFATGAGATLFPLEDEYVGVVILASPTKPS